MNIFDVLNNVGSIGSGIAGLYDYITNTSGQRQLAMQKDLMRQQYGYQSELMDIQNQYNTASMATQQRYNQQNMALAQDYAQRNMGTQFAMNSALSNASRNMIALRNAGINPANGSSSASSVGLPSSTVPTSTPLASGSGGGIGLGSVNSSRAFQHIPLVSSRVLHQNMLDDSETRMNDTRLQTQLAQQYAELQRTKAETEKYLKDSGLKDAQIKEILDPISGRIAALKVQMETQQKNADSNAEVAAAATKNAQTNEQHLAVDQQNADTAKRQVDAIWEKLPLEKDEIKANIQRAKAQSDLFKAEEKEAYKNADYLEQKKHESSAQEKFIRDQSEYYWDKVSAEIDRNRSIAHAAEEQSKLTHKDVEYYEIKMWVDLGCKVVKTLGDVLPIKEVLKTIANKLLKSKDKSKVKAGEEMSSAVEGKSDEQVQSWIDAYLEDPNYSPITPKQ